MKSTGQGTWTDWGDLRLDADQANTGWLDELAGQKPNLPEVKELYDRARGLHADLIEKSRIYPGESDLLAQANDIRQEIAENFVRITFAAADRAEVSFSELHEAVLVMMWRKISPARIAKSPREIRDLALAAIRRDVSNGLGNLFLHGDVNAVVTVTIARERYGFTLAEMGIHAEE